MKKLFLAPFLLASLFSLGGELKANPRYANSTPTPTASVERWYMVTIATNQRKSFTGYTPCPLRSYWYYSNGTKVKSQNKDSICREDKHNHSFTFSNWIDTDQAPVQPSNIAFKSLAECNAQARVIKDFYDSYRYDQTISRHRHWVSNGPGGWDKKPNLWFRGSYDEHEHSTQGISTSRFNFVHKCIKGTVDY